MKDLAGRIAALPPDKQVLLLQRLKQQQRQPIHDPPAAEGWILRYRPNPQARLRLFCFPYAGGTASLFRPWADELLPEIEVCAVQLPGREHRLAEPPYTRMEPLIEDLAAAISPYLDRPFAFFGHSLGALICFELARRLRTSHDRHPLRLCISAHRAPQLPNPNITIYHLPAEMFKAVLGHEGIPETILQNDELMQALLPILRADFAVYDTYEYSAAPPLACPLSIFGGLEDTRISAASLEAWREQSSSACTLRMIPGNHFFLHSAQELMLAAIAEDLQIEPSLTSIPG
jgi:surfactin synthase thioesterase subunit